MESKEF